MIDRGDDKTLKSYQLTSGTVINMVLALRGGSMASGLCF